MQLTDWKGEVYQVVFPGILGGTVVCVYYVDDDGKVQGEASWEPPGDARARFKNPEVERTPTAGGGWARLEDDGQFTLPDGGTGRDERLRLAVPIKKVNTLTQCHLQKLDWVSLKMVGPRVIKPARKGGRA